MFVSRRSRIRCVLWSGVALFATLLEEGGLEGKPVSTIVNATAGRASYVRLDSGAAWAPSRTATPNIAISTKYAWQISEVPAAQAQAEITSTRQVRAEAQ